MEWGFLLGANMSFLWFIAGFVTCYIMFEIGKNIVIRDSFKRIELQFLLGSLYLLQYKYQVLQIINIVYDRASEDDPNYNEERKKVLNSIEEKYNSFGNVWINQLKSLLPYDLEYKNWNEAIEHGNKLFSKREVRK